MTQNPASITVTDAVLAYPIGPYVKGSIKGQLMNLFQDRDAQKAREVFTALKGVSFSVKAGEKIGIIGPNGAGKSTLLRALAGIYPLEEGNITTQGRIQSLFDFGLGFEADSTGRENILYRGLAMGCEPKDIAVREADIVAFADIGAFIDRPIRTYSAGMFVRLAFAISSYLDGEILLIDEVFGAGDAAFRARAVARMEEMVQKAKIVLFVSHELATVEKLCTRVLWLEGGLIRADGAPQSVISHYLDDVARRAA